MKILITGGTGFIGEHFVPLLLEKGYFVTLLVRDIEKAKKKFGDSCKYIIGDITKKETLVDCCENIDIVYHMVAKVGNDLPSEKNFEAFRLVNVEGTKNIIYESKKSNIKKFIFVSSIAAMGIVKENPISEKSKCEPYLPYQISKYEAEKIMIEEYKKNGFPGLIIRPTKVYGVGEHEYSYLTLAKLCKKGLFLKIGNGDNYNSNIYVTDLCRTLVQSSESGIIGEVYILTSDGSIGFIELGKIISSTLERKIIIFKIPTKIMIILASLEERFFLIFKKKPIVTKRNVEAVVMDRVYDITKAKKDFGFKPEVNLYDGIQRVINWYIDNGLM